MADPSDLLTWFGGPLWSNAHSQALEDFLRKLALTYLPFADEQALNLELLNLLQQAFLENLREKAS